MSEFDAKNYPFTVRHLSKEDGGGYLIEFPDLPGCMSDGETLEETIQNGYDAVVCWIEAAKEMQRHVPKPGEFEMQSGKWVQRVSKSLHLQLVERANAEGISLNTLVIELLARSMGSAYHGKQKILGTKIKNSNKAQRAP